MASIQRSFQVSNGHLLVRVKALNVAPSSKRIKKRGMVIGARSRPPKKPTLASQKRQKKSDMTREVLTQFLSFAPEWQEAILKEICRRRSTVKMIQDVHSGSFQPPTPDRREKDRDEEFKTLLTEMKSSASIYTKGKWENAFSDIKKLLDISKEKREFEAILMHLDQKMHGDAVMHAALQGRVLHMLRHKTEEKQEIWPTYLRRIRESYHIAISYRDAERKIRWFQLVERFPKLMNAAVAVRRVWNCLAHFERMLHETDGDVDEKKFWRNSGEEVVSSLPAGSFFTSDVEDSLSSTESEDRDSSSSSSDDDNDLGKFDLPSK